MKWDFSELSKLFLKDDKGELSLDANFSIEREAQRVTARGSVKLYKKCINNVVNQENSARS